MLLFDAVCVNASKSKPKPAGSGKDWQKTQCSNLTRCVPSGTFFARMRVHGNLNRKGIKTDLLSVARPWLASLEKNEREAAETHAAATKGKMTFDDCAAIYQSQTEVSNLLLLASSQFIRKNPHVGRERQDLTPAGIRSWRMGDFPRWLFFYGVTDDGRVVFYRVRSGTMNLVVMRMETGQTGWKIGQGGRQLSQVRWPFQSATARSWTTNSTKHRGGRRWECRDLRPCGWSARSCQTGPWK